MEKVLVAGVDLGVRNIGLTVKNLQTGEVQSSASSLLIRKDGKRYSKWEEKHGAEMCYHWIQERWDDIFSKCKIVVVEKQRLAYTPQHFHRTTHELERCTLYVEACFRSIFTTRMHLMDGPLVTCVAPVWWKACVGVKIGGHAKTLTQQQQHAINKGRAQDLFKELYNGGDEEVRKLVHTHAQLTTDQIESYFIVRALVSNLEKKVKEATKTSHHSKKLSEPEEEVTEEKPKKKRKTTATPKPPKTVKGSVKPPVTSHYFVQGWLS